MVIALLLLFNKCCVFPLYNNCLRYLTAYASVCFLFKVCFWSDENTVCKYTHLYFATSKLFFFVIVTFLKFGVFKRWTNFENKIIISETFHLGYLLYYRESF